MIRDKVAAAIRNDITPILCIGDSQHERKEGLTKRVIHDQLITALSDLTARGVSEMVIAYEPLWAISTFQGEYAKPNDVADVLHQIRSQIGHLYGERVASAVRLLYGGSVDSSTVRGYLEVPGCDGALVGHASLNPYHFADIIEAAYRMRLATDDNDHEEN